MNARTRIKLLYLTRFSRPSCERPLYQALSDLQPRRIVELGVGTGQRIERFSRWLQECCPHSPPASYVGVDLFEARPRPDSGLSYKRAYVRLRQLPLQVRLIPGDPHTALATSANGLAGTDLLLVSADQHGEALDHAWFFVPRMLHAGSQVWVELPGNGNSETTFQQLPRQEVERRAQRRPRATRRAA